ncbi:hypothetical protein AVEN_253518-1 [Araneus ventricosus]|uniref:Uncharacterized protein n=1 Tax=Araneus ventricosus TaxID=182803 RepID=A0A4Y2BV85_ARAVE|nr:hypothetical protein AVEN_253518-1 [Araneus ventricosus]
MIFFHNKITGNNLSITHENRGNKHLCIFRLLASPPPYPPAIRGSGFLHLPPTLLLSHILDHVVSFIMVKNNRYCIVPAAAVSDKSPTAKYRRSDKRLEVQC